VEQQVIAMPQNIEQSKRAEALPESILKSTRVERLITAKDAANLLRLSASWLAKARMRGDGPAYVKLGRAIRYRESVLLDWVKSRSRVSTSDW
jgi:predicted DNA-binding transcriptional regulator AlpA